MKAGIPILLTAIAFIAVGAVVIFAFGTDAGRLFWLALGLFGAANLGWWALRRR